MQATVNTNNEPRENIVRRRADDNGVPKGRGCAIARADLGPSRVGVGLISRGNSWC